MRKLYFLGFTVLFLYASTQTVATHYGHMIAHGDQGNPPPSIEATVDYCSTGSESADYEYIGNVFITGGVNNNTDNSTYSDFVSTNVANVFQGQFVKVVIEKGVSDWYSTDVAYVFADFNQDGDFNDPGELVGSKSGSASPYQITFMVPPTATLGNTRLRIKFGNTDPVGDAITDDPCQAIYSFGETEDYGLLITTPPSCIPPHGLAVLPNSSTEELISWEASGTNPSSGYIWEIRSYGDGGSGAGGLEATGTTAAGVLNATATGLTGGTNYFLWVRSDCGGGDLSIWEGPLQFLTTCDPTTVPFIQNFDAAVEPDLPPCLMTQDQNGATGWRMFFGGSPGAASDLASIRYEPSADTPADDWFFLQGLTLTGGKPYILRFKYKASDGPALVEDLEVKYGTSPNAAGMTTGVLFSQTGIANNIDSPFETAMITFTPPSTGVYYLGFHALSAAGQAFLYIDDIAVESCATPTNVKAHDVSSTSVEIDFTSPGSNFVIEYGPVGFAPGSDGSAGAGTVITNATSPVTITGLDAGTAYDIYVRQNCDGGTEFSQNAMTTTRTLCAPTTVPYMMDFESGTAPDVYPSCTSVWDVNGSSGPVQNSTGGQWIIGEGVSPDMYVSSTKTLRYIYDAVNTARGADDWFFLQGLDLTAGISYRLKFFYKGSNGPDVKEKLEVMYGNSAQPSAMTNLLYENNNINTAVANPWDSVHVDFTPTSTGTYYIGFHAKSDPDQAVLYLDDVSVRTTPVVDVGVSSIKEALPTCPADNFVMTANVVNYNPIPLNLATYPLTVTADITGAAATTLTANVNTGTIAPGATLQVLLPAFTFNDGVHNITFTVNNPNDSENGNDSYVTSVYVNPVPAAAILTPVDPQSCALISTQFAASSTDPVVTWSPAAGLFTDAAGTVPYVPGTNAYSVYANPVSATTYTVTSDAAGCANSSTVTVKPLALIANWPTKVCISDEIVALSATPAGGTWSGIGVSGNNFIPSATAVGSYPLTYRYTNSGGCMVSTTITAKVEDCPERARPLRDNAVILYPNPSNGQFNIRINSMLYNNLIMGVYTNSGLLVYNRKLTGLAYGRVVPIDLTNLPGGAYMVYFYYEGGNKTSDKVFPIIIGKK